MIYVGLTGWGDHDSLYPAGISARDKLHAYASHFPVVEVDSSFYAIPSETQVRKWSVNTPNGFKFIVKAYQGMTGHQRTDLPFSSKNQMYEVFKLSIQPMIDHGKLSMVLFQFPPWFDCQRKNVEILRDCRERMGDIPVALEFRHQSWFSNLIRERTLDFMKREEWIHSICDEPQAGLGSVPTVLEPTNTNKTLIRFHGRNVHGWRREGNIDWRAVRYLYRYNKDELLEWVENIQKLTSKSKEVVVLFNNNSGGDAADNAKELVEMLGIEFDNLAPRQLDLF